MHAKGYEFVGDLLSISLDNMRILLGDALGNKVFDLVRGIDRRKVGEGVHDKSISYERTLVQIFVIFPFFYVMSFYLWRKNVVSVCDLKGF